MTNWHHDRKSTLIKTLQIRLIFRDESLVRGRGPGELCSLWSAREAAKCANSDVMRLLDTLAGAAGVWKRAASSFETERASGRMQAASQQRTNMQLAVSDVWHYWDPILGSICRFKQGISAANSHRKFKRRTGNKFHHDKSNCFFAKIFKYLHAGLISSGISVVSCVQIYWDHFSES